MKTLKILTALAFTVLGALVVALMLTPAPEAKPGDKPYQMARYFLRQYIRNDLGAEPNNFTIYGGVNQTGPLTWTASGSYVTPLGPSLTWQMRIYGPYGGDMWRNCELAIDGEVAFKVGSAVPCG